MWVKQCHKPSPSPHHFYRWYVYLSQSWVGYGITLPIATSVPRPELRSENRVPASLEQRRSLQYTMYLYNVNMYIVCIYRDSIYILYSMYIHNTADGCKILHHQKDGWNPINGILPTYQLAQDFSTIHCM